MRSLCEHPAWMDGRRAVSTETGVSIAKISPAGLDLPDPGLVADLYDPASLSEAAPESIHRVLTERGPVTRLRTPDLWEAIATAIIRQVIRADQARKMFRRIASDHGDAVAGSFLFPAPEKVLSLNAGDFTRMGAAFKRRPLQAAAEAYLSEATRWACLAASDLVQEIQAVPRIGPWTAGAAVADHTGDFAHYPYGDLAVRTYARRAFPDLDLPGNEADFAVLWMSFAATDAELSALTALTLSLGDANGPAHLTASEP